MTHDSLTDELTASFEEWRAATNAEYLRVIAEYVEFRDMDEGEREAVAKDLRRMADKEEEYAEAADPLRIPTSEGARAESKGLLAWLRGLL